jgi:NADPH:quinone reductase-like Zn-dependent oxidoreductase
MGGPMKAAVLVKIGSASSAFDLRDLPDPLPGDSQIRVAVEYSGINFADIHARLGIYREAPPLPCVLGYEVVGRIDAVGRDCPEFRPGTRVVAMTRFGGYATKALSTRYGVAQIPEDFDGAAATALATQFTTAWYAAEEMVRLHEGDRVLIHSATGGVGIALVQIAKRHGCTVVGVTGSPSKLEFLRTHGVDIALTCRDGSIVSVYREAEGDIPLDVIFDPIGGSQVRTGMRLLGAGGRMVCMGVSGAVGPHAGTVRSLRNVLALGVIHPAYLMLRSKGIIGINMLEIGGRRPRAIRRCLDEVVTRAIAGELRPVVGKVYSAAEIAEAHEDLERRRTVGKIALRW